jgi:primase-polymerase (primpol)-like protein
MSTNTTDSNGVHIEGVDIPAEPSTDLLENVIQEGAYSPPESMLNDEIFICYQIEGNSKVPKRPGGTSPPTNIDPTDLENAVPYYEAKYAVHKSNENFDEDDLDGVGVVLHEENDLVGIDIDNAFDADAGDIEEWALNLVSTVDSYAEVSPSRSGLHILARGELDEEFQNRNDELGLEMYDADRYFTFTGRTLRECPVEIEQRGDVVRDFQRAWLDEDESESITDHVEVPNQDVELTDDDEAIIQKASTSDEDFRRLYNGDTSIKGSDHSRADFSLCCKLAYWCKSDAKQMDRIFRKSGLMRQKWDEDRGSQTYGEMTIKEAIRVNGH